MSWTPPEINGNPLINRDIANQLRNHENLTKSLMHSSRTCNFVNDPRVVGVYAIDAVQIVTSLLLNDIL